MTGLVAVVALVVATSVAATRAGIARRRAAVIGRVAAPRPLGARPARSLRRPPQWLADELAGLDVPLDAHRIWRVWRWTLAATLVVGTALVGVVFGVLCTALTAGAPLIARAILRSRAEAAYDDTLAAALDAAGRGVRSGGSLPHAVTEASASVRGAVAADLARVAAEVERGRPFADALAGWRAARDRPAVRLAVGALTLATETGGPPARVVEDVAAAIRTRQQVAREAHALAAQARLSAIVVGVAPVVFMLVTCVTDPRNSRMLFGTTIGIACVVTGLALDAIGAMWMHRMSAAVAG